MHQRIAFPSDDQAINLGYQRSLGALLVAIKETFSSEATLYVEGVTAPDVEAFLESAEIEPEVDVARGTAWPKTKFFHVPLTAENLDALLEFTVDRGAGYL